ncbi:hypothetical protein GYB59_02810 [bacterium]|nr:hypothetical protein [bacterium]
MNPFNSRTMDRRDCFKVMGAAIASASLPTLCQGQAAEKNAAKKAFRVACRPSSFPDIQQGKPVEPLEFFRRVSSMEGCDGIEINRKMLPASLSRLNSLAPGRDKDVSDERGESRQTNFIRELAKEFNVPIFLLRLHDLPTIAREQHRTLVIQEYIRYLRFALQLGIPSVGIKLYSRVFLGWDGSLDYDSDAALQLVKAAAEDREIRRVLERADQEFRPTILISNDGGTNGDPRRLSLLIDRINGKLTNTDDKFVSRFSCAAYVNFFSSKIEPVAAVEQLTHRIGALGIDMRSLLPFRAEREQASDPFEIVEFPEACRAAVGNGFNGFVTVRRLTKESQIEERVNLGPIKESVSAVSNLSKELVVPK